MTNCCICLENKAASLVCGNRACKNNFCRSCMKNVNFYYHFNDVKFCSYNCLLVPIIKYFNACRHYPCDPKSGYYKECLRKEKKFERNRLGLEIMKTGMIFKEFVKIITDYTI